MVYKKYTISIIVKILLLLISSFILSFLILKTELYYTIFGVSCLIAFQLNLLIKYFNKTIDLLEKYFSYFKEQDTTINPGIIYKKTPHKDLANIFNEINNLIKNAKIEKEHHYQYLQFIFEHIPIGLIAINIDSKEIKSANSNFLKILDIKAIKTLSDLEQIDIKLKNVIEKIAPGKNLLFKYSTKNEIISLSIKSSQFKIGRNKIKLISLQNINQELDIKEVESWQKLTRVLTHEIMNSVSPIIGLAQTTKEFFLNSINSDKFNEFNEDEIDSIYTGVNIIKERSEGLKEFVEKYRSITKISNPNFKEFQVFELIKNIASLFAEQFKSNSIDFKSEISPKNMSLIADQKLIEQVLINLIKNAIDSIQDKINPQIILYATQINNQKYIWIEDNGKGITNEDQEKIFLPFYTTKDDGSGIGLSISKQIMRLHNGNISVKSNLEDNTIFKLEF